MGFEGDVEEDDGKGLGELKRIGCSKWMEQDIGTRAGEDAKQNDLHGKQNEETKP